MVWNLGFLKICAQPTSVFLSKPCTQAGPGSLLSSNRPFAWPQSCFLSCWGQKSPFHASLPTQWLFIPSSCGHSCTCAEDPGSFLENAQLHKIFMHNFRAFLRSLKLASVCLVSGLRTSESDSTPHSSHTLSAASALQSACIG